MPKVTKSFLKNTTPNQNKTKPSKPGISPFPNVPLLIDVGTPFLSPLYLSSW